MNDLFAREWQYGLRESPTFASFLGGQAYNDRWPDVSLEAIERRHNHQKEVLAELEGFKADGLEPADRLNLRLFRRQLETEIEEYAHRTFLVPLTQREGIQDESSVADSLSFDTREGLRRLDCAAKKLSSVHGPDDRPDATGNRGTEGPAKDHDGAIADTDSETDRR